MIQRLFRVSRFPPRWPFSAVKTAARGHVSPPPPPPGARQGTRPAPRPTAGPRRSRRAWAGVSPAPCRLHPYGPSTQHALGGAPRPPAPILCARSVCREVLPAGLGSPGSLAGPGRPWTLLSRWGAVGGGDIMSYQKILKFKSDPSNLNRKVRRVKRPIGTQIYARRFYFSLFINEPVTGLGASGPPTQRPA